MDWLTTHHVFFVVVLIAWIVVTAIALRGGPPPRGDGADAASPSRDSRRHARVLDLRTMCWSLGTSAGVSFLICVLWGLVTPEALHMHGFLERILPSFTWLTWWSVLLGLIESFLYGVYVGLVFVPIHNYFSRRFSRSQ